MRYVERPPAAALEPFIECLWTVEDARRQSHRPIERVVPDGCPELIVHLRDPFSRRDAARGRWISQPAAFLAGPLTAPWLLRPGPRVRCLGVRFRPGCVRGFFDVDLSLARDREVRLTDLLGTETTRGLRAELVGARSVEERFALLEGRLAIWRAKRALRETFAAEPAVQLLLARRGVGSIAALAAEVGSNPRRLERAFARELGLSPKQFARIIRFQAVLARLDESERASAVDVALEMGYFDQSHLLLDARQLAGRALRSGREGDGAMASHFTGSERLRSLVAAAK